MKIDTVCFRCGDLQDPHNKALVVTDEGEAGGMGSCGDMHEFITPKIMNLTPHDIVVGGFTIPSEGLARCESSSKLSGDIWIGGKRIPINRKSFGAVQGLPAPREGTSYIVSGLVLAQCEDRSDVFSPDQLVRDEGGRIVGCNALAATLAGSPTSE